MHQKGEVERKYGVPMSERTSDYVPRSDYEEQALEVSAWMAFCSGVLRPYNKCKPAQVLWWARV